jgi:hypothetical protein
VGRVGQVECGGPFGKTEPILVEPPDAETVKARRANVEIADTRNTWAEVYGHVERKRSVAVRERVTGLETNRLVPKSVSTDGSERRCRR